MGCCAFLVHFFRHKKNLQGWNIIPCRFFFAESGGFEPSIRLRVYRISSAALSTTQTTFRFSVCKGTTFFSIMQTILYFFSLSLFKSTIRVENNYLLNGTSGSFFCSHRYRDRILWGVRLREQLLLGWRWSCGYIVVYVLFSKA